MSQASSLEGLFEADLARILEKIVELLPAQGPISVFVHHNTLHALEHLPFETAVLEGARLFGCEPFLSEDDYRRELRDGRILESDLVAELTADVGDRGRESILGDITRHDLRRRILVHGIPEASGPTLSWLLSESNALLALRDDLPADAREAFGVTGQPRTWRSETASDVPELWSACEGLVKRSKWTRPNGTPTFVRHRDLIFDVFGLDIDDWVHPHLIRSTAAFLDQGLADWPMPGRDRGLFACFVDLYKLPVARLASPLGSRLQRIVREEAKTPNESARSLSRSLAILGIARSDVEPFLVAEALALPGYAGMVHQFEIRPDRVPTYPVPARLLDFLAVRLLLVRASLEHGAHQIGFDGELCDLRRWLVEKRIDEPASNDAERAWRLFHVAQLCGFDARAIEQLDEGQATSLEEELESFNSLARRRILHLAYERHLRHRYFDAVVSRGLDESDAPSFQAVFCIDEREESFRRHIEEIEPDAETFGAAGFYGVAMYYQATTDAHPRPLCPVAIQPRHHVLEIPHAGLEGVRERWRRRWNRLGALVDKNVHLGGRHAGRGAILMATLGVLWVVPLVMRVLFPWLRRETGRLIDKMGPAVKTRLVVEDTGERPVAAPDDQIGFTTDEMAEIVRGILAPLGIKGRFARLVLVFGHGSTSLNNPHESAHDCGACGGGRGGPNARAFAQMANHPEVRELLARDGLRIPESTWFVGGQRNTASNEVDLFDVDQVPEALDSLLRSAEVVLDEARRREAHERCRRFDGAALWLPAPVALMHVQTRSTDLGQPRPEYGHASNAVCFVGRRSRTRGLFLDRRAFLVSYDPTVDPDGVLLDGLLQAVVPVIAGINLEYLFGYVDPLRYGSGTKLPHNVTGLVGVMDGAESDLRTGLPWQMLEIHEPVRLSVVVEVAPETLERLVDETAALKRLVCNRWIFLAALDPDSGAVFEIGAAGVREYTPEHSVRIVLGDSRAHYHGRRGHLPFVAIETDRPRVP